MKRIRLHCILFDLDGTLYRSSEYSNHLEQELTQLVSEELTLDKPQAKLLLEQTRRMVGTLTGALERLGINRLDFYQKIASRLEPSKYLSPDVEVRDALLRLKRMGYQIGLVSNSGHELVDKVLDAIGLETAIFDTIVTSTETEPKPSPAPFLLALKNLGCSKSETVYVGDREEAELRPAQQLGLKTILLASEGNMSSQWADAVVSRISDIPTVLSNPQR